MDYQDFERLYHDAPVIFHLGMELFEERGRNTLLAGADQTLCAAVRRKLSDFFAEDRIMDVVNAARGFAGLNALDRLTYAARCGAAGKEAYRMVFDCHCHVKDKHGKPSDRRNQNK